MIHRKSLCYVVVVLSAMFAGLGCNRTSCFAHVAKLFITQEPEPQVEAAVEEPVEAVVEEMGGSLTAPVIRITKGHLYNLYYAIAHEVIATNSVAVTEEDMSTAMNTVHPDSPLYKSTERALAQVFALDLDLKSEFEITNVLSDKDTLRVDTVFSTRKVGGESPFWDNELTTVQVLKKHDDQWKIWGVEVLSVNALPNDEERATEIKSLDG